MTQSHVSKYGDMVSVRRVGRRMMGGEEEGIDGGREGGKIPSHKAGEQSTTFVYNFTFVCCYAVYTL